VSGERAQAHSGLSGVASWASWVGGLTVAVSVDAGSVVVGVSSGALLPATGVRVVFLDESGAKRSGALEVLLGTGFEHVSPVRSFGSFQGQRSFQGSWWFATTGEHVGFESWVERDAVMLLDFDPDVVAVSSQPFCLTWAGRLGARRHVPDFFARRADGSAVVIDVLWVPNTYATRRYS
jgi:hypothetical protein